MGHLYSYAPTPIGHPAPFPHESDLETFLSEQRGLLGEHLGSGDNLGTVPRVWRQLVLPTGGRLDLLFLVNDGGSYILYLAELKNDAVGTGAVKQVAAYLDAWRSEKNVAHRATVSAWLESNTDLSTEAAGGVALDVQGLLVAPSYTSEGVEALVDRAKQAPASPVAALKLLRFKAETGGFIVLVDDMFVRPRKGQRRSFRWVDLHRRIPDLVTEDTPFVMEFGTETIQALPDFEQGQGKNLRIVESQLQKVLDALPAADARSAGICVGTKWRAWEQQTLRELHARLQAKESIPMSKLSLYLQRAFGGDKEPDWQRPAHLWRRRDEPRLFIHELDDMLK